MGVAPDHSYQNYVWVRWPFDDVTSVKKICPRLFFTCCRSGGSAAAGDRDLCRRRSKARRAATVAAQKKAISFASSDSRSRGSRSKRSRTFLTLGDERALYEDEVADDLRNSSFAVMSECQAKELIRKVLNSELPAEYTAHARDQAGVT